MELASDSPDVLWKAPRASRAEPGTRSSAARRVELADGGNSNNDGTRDRSAKEAVMAEEENEDRLRSIEATLEQFKRRLERLEAAVSEAPATSPAAADEDSFGERSP
jgi:hypothetical protein